MKRELRVFSEGIYILGDKALEIYLRRMGIKKTQFYEKVSQGIFISGKIGNNVVILEQSIIDYLELTPEEKKGFVAEMGLQEYWMTVGWKKLGKRATVVEIAMLLGLSPKTINNHIKKQRGIVEIYPKGSKKRVRLGSIDTMEIGYIIKDATA